MPHFMSNPDLLIWLEVHENGKFATKNGRRTFNATPFSRPGFSDKGRTLHRPGKHPSDPSFNFRRLPLRSPLNINAENTMASAASVP
jgi:hypothetical protein